MRTHCRTESDTGRGRSLAEFRLNSHRPSLERSSSFPCWARQYEVAVRALVGGTRGDPDYELARLLPTRLTKAAFLLWDSLPAVVQDDYPAVKERLLEAFGQRHFLDCFRANISAHSRAPGQSLDVYAADISQLVQEAFPGYGEIIAQKEEKFCRFLVGLDPTLRAKCHEQGATDLEEALVIAGRCEMARETLRMDYSVRWTTKFVHATEDICRSGRHAIGHYQNSQQCHLKLRRTCYTRR